MSLDRTATPTKIIAALLMAGGLIAPAAAQQQPASAQGPAPAQGDVQRADFIRAMDAEFARRDADKNGIVTRAELEQFERGAAQALAQDQNRRLFVQLDKDRNGQLSPVEFAAVVGQVPFQDVSQQMKRLDKNQDQQVTLIEYRATTLAGFDRLDTNLDGVVTAEEMRAGNVPVPPR